MKRLLLVVALGLLLLAGHVVYWYGPRARADAPDPRGAAVASRLAGSAAAAEPPSFGPFEVPPASEIVACSDLRGGRVKVIARIYPIIAAVARLAGTLAGNPWLGGGEAGRVSVAWSGSQWTVTVGEEEAPDRSQ